MWYLLIYWRSGCVVVFQPTTTIGGSGNSKTAVGGDGEFDNDQSGKPRFIAVTRLEDVQAVRCAEFHPHGAVYAVGSNSKTLRICAYPKVTDIRSVKWTVVTRAVPACDCLVIIVASCVYYKYPIALKCSRVYAKKKKKSECRNPSTRFFFFLRSLFSFDTRAKPFIIRRRRRCPTHRSLFTSLFVST